MLPRPPGKSESFQEFWHRGDGGASGAALLDGKGCSFLYSASKQQISNPN